MIKTLILYGREMSFKDIIKPNYYELVIKNNEGSRVKTIDRVIDEEEDISLFPDSYTSIDRYIYNDEISITYRDEKIYDVDVGMYNITKYSGENDILHVIDEDDNKISLHELFNMCAMVKDSDNDIVSILGDWRLRLDIIDKSERNVYNIILYYNG